MNSREYYGPRLPLGEEVTGSKLMENTKRRIRSGHAASEGYDT